MLIAVIITTVFYLALITYYILGWHRLSLFKAGINYTPQTYITIVLPVRNEEKVLDQCLQKLLTQDYPGKLYEVIVVDDFSTDGTAAVAEKYMSAGIKLLKLGSLYKENELLAHKKKAIEEAVKTAKGQIIVTTDADCFVKPGWLRTLANYYETTGAKFIAGPVVMQNRPGLLNQFQAIDMLGMTGIAGASIAEGFPVLCNGGNLAFEKKAFFEINGYEGVDAIPSGDDIYLMLKMHKQYPGRVHYLKSEQAVVTTAPEQSLPSLRNQRLRWASKSTKFNNRGITAILAFTYLYNLLLLLLFLAGFYNGTYWLWLIISLMAKLSIEYLFIRMVAKNIGYRHSLLAYLPVEILHIFYVLMIGFFANFTGYTWKGRKV